LRKGSPAPAAATREDKGNKTPKVTEVKSKGSKSTRLQQNLFDCIDSEEEKFGRATKRSRLRRKTTTGRSPIKFEDISDEEDDDIALSEVKKRYPKRKVEESNEAASFSKKRRDDRDGIVSPTVLVTVSKKTPAVKDLTDKDLAIKMERLSKETLSTWKGAAADINPDNDDDDSLSIISDKSSRIDPDEETDVEDDARSGPSPIIDYDEEEISFSRSPSKKGSLSTSSQNTDLSQSQSSKRGSSRSQSSHSLEEKKVSLEDFEARLQSRASRTIRVETTDNLTYDQVVKLPELLSNINVEAILISHYFFVDFANSSDCGTHATALRDKGVSCTFYCTECAFISRMPGLQHTGCTSDRYRNLNKLCKVSIDKIPDLGTSNSVLLVRSHNILTMEKVRELDTLQKKAKNIYFANSFFVVYRDKIDANKAIEHLNSVSQSGFAARLGQGITFKATAMVKTFGYKFSSASTNHNDKVRAARDALCQTLVNSVHLRADLSVLILGPVLKNIVSDKSERYQNFLRDLFERNKCDKVEFKVRRVPPVANLNASLQFEYTHYGLAFMKTPEDVRSVLESCQYHYLLFQHVNVTSCERFISLESSSHRKSTPSPACKKIGSGAGKDSLRRSTPSPACKKHGVVVEKDSPKRSSPSPSSKKLLSLLPKLVDEIVEKKLLADQIAQRESASPDQQSKAIESQAMDTSSILDVLSKQPGLPTFTPAPRLLEIDVRPLHVTIGQVQDFESKCRGCQEYKSANILISIRNEKLTDMEKNFMCGIIKFKRKKQPPKEEEWRLCHECIREFVRGTKTIEQPAMWKSFRENHLHDKGPVLEVTSTSAGQGTSTSAGQGSSSSVTTAVKRDVDKLEDNNSRLKEIANKSDIERARLNDEIGRLKDSGNKSDIEKDRLKDETAQLKECANKSELEKDLLKDETARLKECANKSNMEKDLLKDEIARLKECANKSDMEKTRLKDDTDRIKELARKADIENARLKDETARIKECANKADIENARLKDETARIKECAYKADIENARLKETVALAENARKDLSEKVAQLNEKAEAREEMVKTRGGELEAVRSVLKLQKESSATQINALNVKNSELTDKANQTEKRLQACEQDLNVTKKALGEEQDSSRKKAEASENMVKTREEELKAERSVLKLQKESSATQINALNVKNSELTDKANETEKLLRAFEQDLKATKKALGEEQDSSRKKADVVEKENCQMIMRLNIELAGLKALKPKLKENEKMAKEQEEKIESLVKDLSKAKESTSPELEELKGKMAEQINLVTGAQREKRKMESDHKSELAKMESRLKTISSLKTTAANDKKKDEEEIKNLKVQVVVSKNAVEISKAQVNKALEKLNLEREVFRRERATFDVELTAITADCQEEKNKELKAAAEERTALQQKHREDIDKAAEREKRVTEDVAAKEKEVTGQRKAKENAVKQVKLLTEKFKMEKEELDTLRRQDKGLSPLPVDRQRLFSLQTELAKEREQNKEGEKQIGILQDKAKKTVQARIDMHKRLAESTIQTRDKEKDQRIKWEMELSSLNAVNASKLEELNSLQNQFKLAAEKAAADSMELKEKLAREKAEVMKQDAGVQVAEAKLRAKDKELQEKCSAYKIEAQKRAEEIINLNSQIDEQCTAMSAESSEHSKSQKILSSLVKNTVETLHGQMIDKALNDALGKMSKSLAASKDVNSVTRVGWASDLVGLVTVQLQSMQDKTKELEKTVKNKEDAADRDLKAVKEKMTNVIALARNREESLLENKADLEKKLTDLRKTATITNVWKEERERLNSQIVALTIKEKSLAVRNDELGGKLDMLEKLRQDRDAFLEMEKKEMKAKIQSLTEQRNIVLSYEAPSSAQPPATAPPIVTAPTARPQPLPQTTESTISVASEACSESRSDSPLRPLERNLAEVDEPSLDPDPEVAAALNDVLKGEEVLDILKALVEGLRDCGDVSNESEESLSDTYEVLENNIYSLSPNMQNEPGLVTRIMKKAFAVVLGRLPTRAVASGR
jgi:glycerol-3-phosphate cytidylyltransferase-like family protein